MSIVTLLFSNRFFLKRLHMLIKIIFKQSHISLYLDCKGSVWRCVNVLGSRYYHRIIWSVFFCFPNFSSLYAGVARFIIVASWTKKGSWCTQKTFTVIIWRLRLLFLLWSPQIFYSSSYKLCKLLNVGYDICSFKHRFWWWCYHLESQEKS